MLETGCLGWQNFTTAHLCFSASRGFPKGTVNCSLVASNDRWLTEFENSQPSVPFLWKGPPIFRGFHCLWLLLDSFFLPLTFLPHKILPPNLHFRYNCFILLNLQLFFFWEVKFGSKSCKFVKKNSVALLRCVALLKTKRSIPICSPWVPFDLGSLYCLFRRTFAHFTKMCIKKQGKASAERRERGKSHFLLALLIPICDSWNFQFFAWWSPSSWAFYQRESTLLSMLQWPHQF